MSIRVLVVDDSLFIRRAVSRMLAADPDFGDIAGAADGQEALWKLRDFQPDVVTLDLNMPTIDGMATLKRIMAERPTPVVLLSSYAQSEAALTLEALAAGAVDFVDKSTVSTMDVHQLASELIRKVKAAASSHPRAEGARVQATRPPDAALVRRPSVFVIGASTGGPAAIQQILTRLPSTIPVPTVLVQHMPPGFTGPFAERLDGRCALAVREAENGRTLVKGEVLIARGGRNLGLRRVGRSVEVVLSGAPRKSVHVPSVDFTTREVVDHYGRGTCLIVLTGMGNDGLEGARAVQAAGGMVIAQAEAGCVVYGMPRAIVNEGLATWVVPLEHIAAWILRLSEARP